MSQKHIFWIVLLFITASIDICVARNLEQNHGLSRETLQLQDKQEALETLRAFELPKADYKILKKNTHSKKAFYESVLAYLFCHTTKDAVLKKWCRLESEKEPETFQEFVDIVSKLFADNTYFPVPEALDDDDAFISYQDSWQYARDYGGVRGHEGCDLMAAVQKRGYYPIVSASDGTVEKMGWLPLGGYRIGIRSPGGVYYYYAHLADYEDGITIGCSITAGQLIGYMGDTGYSEIEGTTGNFPIHLHFGMYLNNEAGEEVSYNTYYLLKILEKRKLTYQYGN